jgi:hypothetical protein
MIAFAPTFGTPASQGATGNGTAAVLFGNTNINTAPGALSINALWDAKRSPRPFWVTKLQDHLE